jgi:hypothetical protein
METKQKKDNAANVQSKAAIKGIIVEIITYMKTSLMLTASEIIEDTIEKYRSDLLPRNNSEEAVLFGLYLPLGEYGQRRRQRTSNANFNHKSQNKKCGVSTILYVGPLPKRSVLYQYALLWLYCVSLHSSQSDTFSYWLVGWFYRNSTIQ